MSYPSTSFVAIENIAGLQGIGSTETTQFHPLGMTVRASDYTYGAGVFIYLKGVASTAAGDLVCYDSKAGTTVRAVHGGTGSNGPCAVAMSANVASQYGWYCIQGSVPVNAATAVANASAYLSSTAGQIDDAVVTGDIVNGLTIKAATSAGFATCQLDAPCVSGDVGAGESPSLASPTISGKLSVSTGSNKSAGQSSAMSSGTVTISTTAVATASLIFLTHAGATSTNQGALRVGTITDGTSFVINSSNGSDADTVNWWIIN